MAKDEAGKVGRVHAIKLSDLIVHKYADHAALLTKADKIARALIDSQLRDGEALQVPRSGIYLIHLPLMTPTAGALRCSILADQIYKEIKRLNPTAIALNEDLSSGADTDKASGSRSSMRSSNGGESTGASVAHRIEKSVRETTNRAFAMMAQGKSGPAELSDDERRILANVVLSFHPVWHTRNKLITAYLSVPMLDGVPIAPGQASKILPSASGDLADANIDAVVYGLTAKALDVLIRQRLKAVLIAPIHFSTVDRLQHMKTLLSAAGEVSEDAQKLLVFELVGIPEDATRYRLREPVAYLRTRARALIARLGFESLLHPTLKEFEFHGVSVNVSNYDWTEDRLFTAFDRFAGDAETHRLQSFVHGLATTSLAVSAVAAGVTYMDGSVVAEAETSPSHLKPFEIDMMYSD